MASYAYTFTSGDTVTPTKLNNARTVSDIVNADIKSDAAIAGSKLADNSVTLAKLVTALQQALVPAGAVQAFAMNSAPSGWLAANGAAVSRTTYAALFSAIGTTYGAGDGSTTFALPDMRGYFVRGSGTNADSVASGTFGAKQAAAMLNHTHTGTTSSDGSHTHTASTNSTGSHNHDFTIRTSLDPGTSSSVAEQGTTAGDVGYTTATSTEGSHSHTVTINSAGAHTHTLTTGNPSVGGGTETRPANIAMLYCIKF
jgi:microcystin-dependent protein